MKIKKKIHLCSNKTIKHELLLYNNNNNNNSYRRKEETNKV